jgi:MHS family proline/betaine transporter-like MFS transporter
LVYLPNYVHEHAGMPLSQSMQINTIATFLLLFFIPLFAWTSDKLIRRKHLLTVVFGCLALIAVPLFLVLQQGAMPWYSWPSWSSPWLSPPPSEWPRPC